MAIINRAFRGAVQVYVLPFQAHEFFMLVAVVVVQIIYCILVEKAVQVVVVMGAAQMQQQRQRQQLELVIQAVAVAGLAVILPGCMVGQAVQVLW
jgi:hypothetical protein